MVLNEFGGEFAYCVVAVDQGHPPAVLRERSRKASPMPDAAPVTATVRRTAAALLISESFLRVALRIVRLSGSTEVTRLLRRKNPSRRTAESAERRFRQLPLPSLFVMKLLAERLCDARTTLEVLCTDGYGTVINSKAADLLGT